MDKRDYLKKRFMDLSRTSFERGIYTFTDFLTMDEMTALHECVKDLYGKFTLFGGYDEAERCMARFGSYEQTGYEQDFPIVCVRISPLQQKFAQALNHRDFLGSLMNLGIERSKLGDIVIKDDSAYVFAMDTIANLICNELTRVKNTSVMGKIIEDAGDIPRPQLMDVKIQIKSERLDAVIAKTYNLSRSQSAELFAAQKVFVGGRLTENESYVPKPGDVISLRGFGKFRYEGVEGTSRKGNLYAAIKKYV